MVEENGTKGMCLPLHFQIAAIWEALLKKQVPSIHSDFFFLGGTRETAVSMLQIVSEETGHSVPLHAFLGKPTIDGVSAFMLPHAVMDRVSSVQRGTSDTAFFYFHGDILGGGFYVRAIAQELGNEVPVYSVPMPNIDPVASTTLTEVAQKIRTQIEAVCHQGPMVIGGFSLGATLAHEVANQLTARGKQVAGLILIDPDLPTWLERRAARRIENEVAGGIRAKADAFNSIYSKLARANYLWHAPLREKLDFIASRFRRRTTSAPAVVEQETSAEGTEKGWRVDLFQWLSASSTLKPYCGPTTLLLTEPQRKARPALARKWRKAAPLLRTRAMPGSHMTVITTYRGELAEKIREVIEAAEPQKEPTYRFASLKRAQLPDTLSYGWVAAMNWLSVAMF